MAKKSISLRELMKGFTQIGDNVERAIEAGLPENEPSKLALKLRQKRRGKPKKTRQGPWLSSRDMRAYRELVAPTKPTKTKVVDEDSEKKRKKTVILPPKADPAEHMIHWPDEDDLHLLVSLGHARARKFQLLRFPESQEDIASLAKWIANMLYDRKTWRNYLFRIEEAVAELKMGDTVEIPVDDKDYQNDFEQDMS